MAVDPTSSDQTPPLVEPGELELAAPPPPAAPPAVLEFSGTLDRIVYYNEENQYTVARFEPDEEEGFTVVGSIYRPSQGQTLRIRGRWIQHPRYGQQLELESYQLILPTTTEGIQRFLASGLIKGIGAHLAGEIVLRFGDATIEVMDRSPRRLLEVRGIGKKRLETILTSWQEQRQVRELMIFLAQHGIGASLAVRIHARYGGEAIARIRENPYQLAMDVDRIGFHTADQLARKLGLDRDAPGRLQAGLLYALHQQSLSNGHLFLPRDVLLGEARKLLELGEEEAGALEAACLGLSAEGHLTIEESPEGAPPGGAPAVYLPTFHQAEVELAWRLARLAVEPPRPILSPEECSGPALARYAEAGMIELTAGQQRALVTALRERISIITGGPGVGKTTLIRRLVAIATERGRQVALAAPTGRAAKRLSEATGHPAKTIHRLLGFNPIDGGFDSNPEHPLEAELVILDEMSMVDLFLMRDLARALSPSASLVLVGDSDQLPSVGPGNVLADLIRCGLFPLTRLVEVFRQARDSAIVTAAHAINAGRRPSLPEGGGGGAGETGALSDFYFIRAEEPERCAELLLRLVQERIPRRFGHHPMTGIQVISPMHRGEVGTAAMNERLQQALNPQGKPVDLGSGRFRIGDKVMQVRNNYAKEVYNGDIGLVAGQDDEESTLQVRFETRVVSYKAGELDDLQLAYCVTVHKSQGSEYPAVVLPLLTQHYLLLQRNLLYTAITRGRELVVVVGSERALDIAIKNDQIRHRWSRLAERLRVSGGKLPPPTSPPRRAAPEGPRP